MSVALILLAAGASFIGLATFRNQRVLAAASSPVSQKAVHQLPSGQGATLIEANCQRCHTLKKVLSQRRTKREWQVVLERMTKYYGAPLSDKETKIVLQYLSTNYGPSKGKGAKNGTRAKN